MFTVLRVLRKSSCIFNLTKTVHCVLLLMQGKILYNVLIIFVLVFEDVVDIELDREVTGVVIQRLFRKGTRSAVQLGDTIEMRRLEKF